MASPKDVINFQLHTSQFLIESFTKDLSDEEYFKIPLPGTNHVAWVLGHIATSEDSTTASLTGTPKRIEQKLQDLFGGGSVCTEDASKYPSRQELDEMFKNARAHALEAVSTFDESKWNDPTPEGYPDFFPNLGSLCSMLGFHVFWHIGHLTVCRVALGKKQVITG